MRLRLILSFALVVTVTIVAVVFFARQGTAQEVNTFMIRGGMTGGDELATLLENYYQQHGSWQGVDLLLSPGGQGRGQGFGGMMGMMSQRLRVTDAQGNVVADTSSQPPSGVISASELQNAIPLFGSAGKTVGYLVAEGGITSSAGTPLGLIRRLNDASIKAALFGGGIALVLAVILAYTLLRPVQQLTEAADGMARGDLNQRVNIRGNDELATLGRSFNQMAASLQQSQAARRAMTADIAHELRTPLSVQKAQLEALQDGIYPLTVENLQPLVEQNQLLEHLVNDLRTLALADAGELVLERVPANLATLVEKSMSRFQVQAAAKEIRLDYTGPDPQQCPEIMLDPTRIEQVLGNLVANALRHTPQGGSIQVSLKPQNGNATIQVVDSGPGIPEEALPHIFERFYRADRSRSRVDGGTGLGLAIARQLVEAHGGTLTAANTTHAGAAFTLVLPRSQNRLVSKN